MNIAVHADEAANGAEALAAILAEDQRTVRFVHALGILRIDDEVRKVEGAPHHPGALVTAVPTRAAIV